MISMVVVKVELWPGGDQSQKRDIGCIMIANDGSGDHETGSYEAAIAHGGAYFGKPGVYKQGKVTGFNRKLSPYHLLARVLKACGIS